MSDFQILRTKISPPRQASRFLFRQRVFDELIESLKYRLTILHAGAGHGKSTALASLSESEIPVIWYQLSDEDGDPFVFLLHLCHATQKTFPKIKGLPIQKINNWDGTRGPLPSKDVIAQYVNALLEGLDQDALLVLDDVHLISDVPEIAQILDRIINLAPSHLHIVLSSRILLKLPNLSRLRSQGDVLTIDQKVLAFNQEEIEELFIKQFDYEIIPKEAELLYTITEGWAITLQLSWQGLKSGAINSIDDLENRSQKTLESLFDVLATEVLDQQPDDIQQFLRETSILQWMTPTICDAVRNATDSKTIMAYLHRQELFVVEIGENGLRYLNIFHQFLRQQVEETEYSDLNSKAAKHYLKNGILDQALFHFLNAGNYSETAAVLTEYGRQLQTEGRLDSLSSYLDSIPPHILAQYPILLFMLGDLARLHSRFQEALGWYQQAEHLCRERGQTDNIGRALRGQARVYLDTVDATKAEILLQQAIRISDRIDDLETQAKLYELLAENKLNAGKLEEAEELNKKARSIRLEGPADEQLQFRVMLRTGKLPEAQYGLEERAQKEKLNPVQTPRGHRETQLLLSLIYSMQGMSDLALDSAKDGMQRGGELDSPFMIAVAHLRQGHALSISNKQNRFQLAIEQYENALEISRNLSVPRLGVEASWGLCRAYGYRGDLAKAQSVAEKGVKTAMRFGDEWVASLIRVAMGASFILSKRYEGSNEWLEEAVRGFEECSDPFGTTAARLWLALNAYWQKDYERLEDILPEVLTSCRKGNYDFLLIGRTFLGLLNERQIIPMLLYARSNDWETGYINELLKKLNLAKIQFHPGYQLRIQSLGQFRVFRGDEKISSKGWRREKSRHLFQLLLSHRKSPLDREQILDYLWPESNLETAGRNFKVAFSTMLNVLEPTRQAGGPSSFILREGSVYGINSNSDIWLDVDEFLELVNKAEEDIEDPTRAIENYEEAIELYRGDYLSGARYENWAAAEREHLSVKYLQISDQLSSLYLDQKNADAVIELCQKILTYDNCWERAYRHLMIAYDLVGDRGQIGRTYHRCTDNLKQELDVSPMDQTTQLYNQLVK